MPILTIFSGINGAGKSTLYNMFTKNHPNADFGTRINMDEILNTFNGNKNSFTDYAKAARITKEKIIEYINKKQSFNWETTVFSTNSFKILEIAKQYGFVINVHYIATQNLNLALERIKTRSSNGGHNVPSSFVKGRFDCQFNNIHILTKLADSIYFYENNKYYKLIGIYHNNKFAYINKKCDWMKKVTSQIEGKIINLV